MRSPSSTFGQSEKWGTTSTHVDAAWRTAAASRPSRSVEADACTPDCAAEGVAALSSLEGLRPSCARSNICSLFQWTLLRVYFAACGAKGGGNKQAISYNLSN